HMIAEAGELLLPSLHPLATAPPSEEEEVAALGPAAGSFAQIGDGEDSRAGKRLSVMLARLAGASPAIRRGAEWALLPGLRRMLAQISTSLNPLPVRIDELPAEIVGEWLATDGRTRLEGGREAAAGGNA